MNRPEHEWVTNTAVSSDVEGLRYGIVVAIPSGMGVALSLLDQNVGGLVGVAISASLLPPAVGAGEQNSMEPHAPVLLSECGYTSSSVYTTKCTAEGSIR